MSKSFPDSMCFPLSSIHSSIWRGLDAEGSTRADRHLFKKWNWSTAAMETPCGEETVSVYLCFVSQVSDGEFQRLLTVMKTEKQKCWGETHQSVWTRANTVARPKAICSSVTSQTKRHLVYRFILLSEPEPRRVRCGNHNLKKFASSLSHCLNVALSPLSTIGSGSEWQWWEHDTKVNALISSSSLFCHSRRWHCNFSAAKLWSALNFTVEFERGTDDKVRNKSVNHCHRSQWCFLLLCVVFLPAAANFGVKEV